MLSIREFSEIAIRFGFIYSHCIADASGVKIAFFYKLNIGKKKTLNELQYAVESGSTVCKKFDGDRLINTNLFDLKDFLQNLE